ncbi:MAG: glycosyltransferase family 2 protein [Muribaculaceae bacterium]|nr:glycosyltransferase family 2 protein [Muribaculaceae bacterium]
MTKVAVIILNWNGMDLLHEFLPSIVRHTPADIADVIVADNGSTDGSVEMLASDFPAVKVMPFAENYGFALGYNKAVADISDIYKYVVLLNSDVEVKGDWLTPLWRYMEANDDVAAVQPKIRAQRQPEMFEYAGAAGGFLDRNGYPYCRGRIFDTVEKDNGQYDGVPLDIHWASGAALMVRRSDYLAVGGLDAAFFAHMEEIDLCWRLRLSGKRVVAITDPGAVVYHVGGATLPQGNPRKVYLNFRNNLLMMWKNLPHSQRRSAIFRRQLLDGIAALKMLLSGDTKSFRAVIRAHRDYRKMRPSLADSNARSNLLKGGKNILTAYYLRSRHTFCSLFS